MLEFPFLSACHIKFILHVTNNGVGIKPLPRQAVEVHVSEGPL